MIPKDELILRGEVQAPGPGPECLGMQPSLLAVPILSKVSCTSSWDFQVSCWQPDTRWALGDQASTQLYSQPVTSVLSCHLPGGGFGKLHSIIQSNLCQPNYNCYTQLSLPSMRTNNYLIKMDQFEEMHRVLEDKISEIFELKQALEAELKSIERNPNRHQPIKKHLAEVSSAVTTCKAAITDLKSLFHFNHYADILSQGIASHNKRVLDDNSRLKQELNRLKFQLEQQIRLNQIMKEEVMDLKEMVSLHVQKAKKEIQERDSIIEILKERSMEGENVTEFRIHEQSVDQTVSKGEHLETISEEEEANLTSRVFNPEEKRIRNVDIMAGSAASEQSEETLVNMLTVTERVETSRKTTESKTRTRFFIEDFRNVVQKTEEFCRESASTLYEHGKLTQSNIECCNESSKVSRVEVESRIYGKSFAEAKKENIEDTELPLPTRGSETKSMRSRSKEKIKLTHVQKTPELKVKDCNIVYSHKGKSSSSRDVPQGSDKKLRLVTVQKRESQSQARNISKWITESLQRVDLYVGDKRTQQHYEGTIKDNSRHGWGRLYYINGLGYEGEFKENLRHGYGTLSLNGKRIYQGSWERDKLSGQGTLSNLYLINKRKLPETCFLRGKSQFSGWFQENCFHGRGVLQVSEDERFEGEFNGGLPCGQFTYFSKYGDIENGYCDVQFLAV